MAYPSARRIILLTGLALPLMACATGRTIEQGEDGGDGGSSSSGGAGGTGLGGSGSAGAGGTGTAGTGVGGSGVGGSAGTGTAGTGSGGSGVGGTGTGGTGAGGTGTGGTGSGGTGSGGTGTGGAGGGIDGGGRCNVKVTATGGDGMIDDFADGNLVVLAKESRMGSWIATGGGTAVVENGALHFTSPASGWASFTVAVAACYDASAYQGIKFKVWGKAPGPLGISFVTPTPPTVVPASGGSCTTAKCGDHFRYKIATIPAAAMEVSFTWAQLKQNGWGDPAPAGYRVPANLMEFGFGGEDEAFAYDFYVDDVQFY